MSTRLRPIAMIADSIRAGGDARILLEDTARHFKLQFPPRGAMPEADRLIEIFRSLPLDTISGRNFLWLFREPRNTPQGRSRYMQLCQYYGVMPHRKKKLAIPGLNFDELVAARDRRRIRDEVLAREQRQQAAQAAQTQAWNATMDSIAQPAQPSSLSSQYYYRYYPANPLPSPAIPDRWLEEEP